MKLPQIPLITPIALIILSLLFLHPFEGGGDFYHHVNTGKQIIEQGTFPFTDIYTHTAEGKPWIAYAWGSGIILYLVFSLFGPIGISLLVCLTGTLTISLLYLLLRLNNISKTISLITISASLGPILTRFPNRPEIFAYPLVLLILITDKLRQKKAWANLFLPLIILTWANIYGSSTIAGISLILLLIGKQLLTDKFKILPTQKSFYTLSLVSCLLSLLNPNTYKTVFYMFIYIPKVSQYEGEWAGIWTILNYTPDSYILLFQYLFLIYFIYLVLFFLTLLFSWKNILKQKFYLLLSLAIFVPIFAFRHLPLAAFLSVPLIAYLLQSKKIKTPLNIILLTSSAIMLSITLWLNPIGLNSNTKSSNNLINFLEQTNLSGKAFNHSTTGSFLSYHLYPKVKVFFDTRDDLFKGNPAFDDLYTAQMTSSSLLPLLEKYQIDIIIADYFTDSLNYRDLLNSKWAIVYLDDRFLVSIPKDKALEKGLTILDSIDPFSQTAAKPSGEQAAENYYQTLLEKNPTGNNKLLLTQTLLAQKKYPQALEILKSLTPPTGPTAVLFTKQQNYFLAKSYLGTKDCQNALIYLNKSEQDAKPLFLFNPSKKLPLIIEDLWAMYYLKCTNDKNQAQEYFKKYLSHPEINPKEKIKFQQLYQSF